MMRALIIALAALPTMAAAPIELTPNPDGPPVDERTPAQIEQARLARFNLSPIAQDAAAKKTVRRVTFHGLFEMPGDPAVVFEKAASGEVAMTVVSDEGKRIDRATLKPEAWAYITKGDLFALSPQKVSVSHEICFSTKAVLEGVERGKARRYDAAMCNGDKDWPAILASRRLARVAVDAIPRCDKFREHAREPAWSLRECLKRTAPIFDKVGERNKATMYLASPDNPPGDELTHFAISTSSELDGKRLN